MTTRKHFQAATVSAIADKNEREKQAEIYGRLRAVIKQITRGELLILAYGGAL